MSYRAGYNGRSNTGGSYHRSSYSGNTHGSHDRMGGLGANLHSINWDDIQKVATEWNFYKPQRQHTEEEIAAWMSENSVTIYGDRVPQPMLQFSDLVAPDAIHQSFMDAGYTRPTPIQSVAWPILLNSRDIVGVAKTGSGKTMAFMIPAALHIMAQPALHPGDGPIALVLAPTRELAVQIESETRKALSRVPSILTTCVYGGCPKGPQYRALRAGVHVCIATPGRLIDMLEAHATNLLRVTYLVLDEADRMLDMGFEDQIRKICSQIRTDRQTLMFSATWPKEIRNLAASFQRDFVRVHIGSEELLANADVRQHVMVVEEHEKTAKLEEVLRSLGTQRVLIFMRTKRSADELHGRLRNALRQTILVIHGDKEQSSRDYVIDRFRNDERAILVATDVAARGLDIKNLDVVINYDLPTNIEDYVHRIGRTGRAGKSGDAFTFVSRNDTTKTLRDLIDIMHRASQVIPPELHAICAYSNNGSYNSGYRRGRGGYRGGRGSGYSGNHYGNRGSASGYANRQRGGGYTGTGGYQPFSPTSMGGNSAAGAAYGGGMPMQHNHHAGVDAYSNASQPQSSYQSGPAHASHTFASAACATAPAAQTQSFSPYGHGN